MGSSRKSVLITGCSANGIGAGLAEAFQEMGYHVFATLRTPSKLPAALASAPNVTVLTLDVLSLDSIAAAVESVKRETGGMLDVLVNNSGGGYKAPALDVSIEEGKKLFDLNYWAPLAMVQAFAPLVIKAKGCIVTNTSASAFMPLPMMSIYFQVPVFERCLLYYAGMYNGSKAAMAHTSETWRLELQPLGVRTITLITLAIKTKEAPRNENIPPIPQSSYYYHIRDFIYDLTDYKLQQGPTLPVRDYALRVVREVEKGSVGMIWVGKNATMTKWAWWLSPRSIRVSFRIPARNLTLY